MPRYAARKDGNHEAISDGLRADGYYVMDLSRAGSGVPDILVGKPGNGITPGFCCPIEIKKDSKAALTPKEQAVRDRWDGPYIVATSLEDAREQLEALRK